MKYFTEREFSGIFSLARGILRLRKGNSRWPWSLVATGTRTARQTFTGILLTYLLP